MDQISAHLDLDGAWGELPEIGPTIGARAWGPKLRYWARESGLQPFFDSILHNLPPYVVYGSGDFHHLTAWLLRRFEGPVTVVCFDNHPDWDIRPPRWSCGSWVDRALQWPAIEQISVWGCGNFELAWPGRIFRSRRGLKSGRLQIYAWAERQSVSTAKRFNCMTRLSWWDRFEKFAESLSGKRVYVTIDLDCLNCSAAITNWESGLFAPSDIFKAVQLLSRKTNIIGADICGAWSPGVYERPFQRFAARWDHPKISEVSLPAAQQINRVALATIWPAFNVPPALVN